VETDRGDGGRTVRAFEAAAEAEQDVVFFVRGMRVGKMNTRPDSEGGGPRWTGLGADVASGDMFCAVFADPSLGVPGFLRRYGRLWLGVFSADECREDRDALEEVWGSLGMLRLAKLQCSVPDEQAAWHERLLRGGEGNDLFVLNATSTSPNFEAPDYCDGVRACVQWMLDNRGAVLPEERYKWDSAEDRFVKLDFKELCSTPDRVSSARA
jgi:hypothetical protein